jgi:hypothetical protein
LTSLAGPRLALALRFAFDWSPSRRRALGLTTSVQKKDRTTTVAVHFQDLIRILFSFEARCPRSPGETRRITILFQFSVPLLLTPLAHPGADDPRARRTLAPQRPGSESLRFLSTQAPGSLRSGALRARGPSDPEYRGPADRATPGRSAPWYLGTSAPRRAGPDTPRRVGAEASRCACATARWCVRPLAPRAVGSDEQGSRGSDAPTPRGAIAPTRPWPDAPMARGAMALKFRGTSVRY